MVRGRCRFDVGPHGLDVAHQFIVTAGSEACARSRRRAAGFDVGEVAVAAMPLAAEHRRWTVGA